MLRMCDFADSSPAIAPDTPGSVVYDRFRDEPDLLTIAVADANGRPVGLIERNAFTLKMGGQYGRSLYAGRPVSLVMDPEPRVVEWDLPLDTFTQECLIECPSDLLSGFIVVKEGRYLGVGNALSLLQAQNVAIRHHAAEAQTALRAKSEFLAVMSHEIRTPLNGVLGVAEVLDRKLTQEALRPYVRTVIASGGTLLRLLNDALDLSRAESGRLELQEDSFRLGSLVEDIDALWRPRATEAGLAFATALEADGDVWALGDAVRLKQVLNNLVGNALKFTTEGSVEVRLRASIDDIYVTVSGEVADTGPGIPADQRPRLFQPFSQTDAGRASGGAGLGLSICRQLIEKMDGSIWVTSEAGRGSTFAFELVLFRTQDPALKPAPEPESDTAAVAARVLIADDNATNRMVAETLCAMFGCQSESVEDGRQALDLAATGRFDLVLMDIKMPVMDGLEATRRIRALAAPTASIPIIALTANTNPPEAETYLAQGFDAVVEKPIKPELLLAAINAALSRVAERRAA